MFIREYTEMLNIDINVFEKFQMKDIIYFDIETTGFDKDEDHIILISIGRFIKDTEFNIKQYFAESMEEESNLLNTFSIDISNFDKWCSYNGIAFDEPFIKKRMDKYNINFMGPTKHIDLYRFIRPYYKQLGMDRCNLKSVERHIGINRTDIIDGGISVNLYNEFLINLDENLKTTIMLHNYEDVLNLPKIHEFIYSIIMDENLIREDSITEKQLRYLKILLQRKNVTLDSNLQKISKKAASRIIDHILKGCTDSSELKKIINNSY